MLKLSMCEEVVEYKSKCEKNIKKAPTPQNAHYWQEKAEDCKRIIMLFNEMKMTWSDWAEMKKIADLNREERQIKGV